MSYKIQDRVWESAKHKGDAMMVLLALASYANNEGVCFPAQDTLAKRARVSRRGLQYILRRLVEAGDVEIVQAGGSGDGGRASTVYRLTPYTEVRMHDVRPTGANGAPHPCTPCAPPAHTVRPTGAPGAPLPAHPMRPNLSSESVSESVNESVTESTRAREEGLRERVSKMFGREPESPWSKAEMIALEAVASLGTSESDLVALSRYYRSRSIPAATDYRRRTLGSLLEHWHGELDRARSWVREQKRKANSIL